MESLPLYCERLVHGGEPLNTLSNLGYLLVAAVVAWRARVSTRSGDSGHRYSDAALVALVGVGSAVYHTWPSPITQAFDVIAIGALVWFLLPRALATDDRLQPRHAGRIRGVWLVASLVASRFASLAHGSLLYVPTLAVLVLIAARASHARRLWQAVPVVFGAALLLRTLDRPLCPVSPPDTPIVGTHIAWHLLGATAVAIALSALSRHASPHSQSSRPR